MIKKNEEILATPKEDIYKEKKQDDSRPNGYWT